MSTGQAAPPVSANATSRADPVLDKVTALVTRGRGAERDLLVFDHPLAGVQLPSGTVERGEPLETAVRREVREETGLVDVTIVARLAALPEPLPTEAVVFLRRVRARTAPGRQGDPVRLGARRGSAAWLRERLGAEARVSRDGVEAWVPWGALTTRLRRHLFHLEASGPTQSSWTVRADGHRFRLRWVPLESDPGLIRPQNGWLDAARPLFGCRPPVP